MISAVIIDDDVVSVKVLESLLKTHFASIIKVAAVAGDSSEAKIMLETFQPDLVFLDIHMPEKNGFELLEELRIVNFEVVVTSGDKNVALDAFKFSVLDFLVKPLTLKDLERSLIKANNKIKIKHFEAPKLSNNKIGLPTSRGIVFVNPCDITYCEAANTYTTLYFANKRSETISRSLKDVAQVLENHNFFRIHKSYLINFDKINQFIRTDGGFIVMEDYDIQLPVSKLIKEDLMSQLKII